MWGLRVQVPNGLQKQHHNIMTYSIISNKTIRKAEKSYKRFKRNEKSLPQLVKTNRGWFMDGHRVDLISVRNWFLLNGEESRAKSICSI